MAYELKQDDIFALARSLTSEHHQKGNELFFKYCPYCNGGTNKDKDTFSINLDTGAFSCFRSSCGSKGHFVELARDNNFPLQDESKVTYRKLPQDRKANPNQKVYDYMAGRNISAETVDKYRLSASNENLKHMVFPFYDENEILQFIKIRNMDFIKGQDKAKEWCVKDCKPILFGMAQCTDASTLVITEGQIDSLTVAECGFTNCVSVPTGCNGFTWLKHCYDWIIKFDKLIVFGDWENGKMTLIDKLRSSLPMKVYSVRHQDYLGEKDANAILCKYGKDAIVKCITNAEIEPVKFVKQMADVESVDIYSMPKIKTGIQEIDKTIGGIYLGQVILLSGKRGEGKSTFMSQIAVEAVEQDFNTFIYSGELPAYHVKRWLDFQVAGGENISEKATDYNDVSYYIADSVVDKINNWYRDKLFVFDNSAIDDEEFEGLLKITTDAICRYDIKLICIDNLMTALDDDAQSDLYRQQSKFVKSLAKMAKQHDVAIVLIAHPKKTTADFDNDAVSGSADITNAVDVVINYQRAKEGDSWDSKLTINKNRLTGKLITNERAIRLVYSAKSKRIQSYENFDKFKQYSLFQFAERKPEVEQEDELIYDAPPF